jgi:hypothetical protein
MIGRAGFIDSRACAGTAFVGNAHRKLFERTSSLRHVFDDSGRHVFASGHDPRAGVADCINKGPQVQRVIVVRSSMYCVRGAA